MNKLIFKADCKYSTYLDELVNSPSFLKREVASRVVAVALSALALFALAIKTVSSLASLGTSAVKSLIERRNAFGNYRENYTEFCEFLRYLFGTICGSAVGVVSPKQARKLFLTETDEVLNKNLDKEQATTLYQGIALMLKLFKKYDIEFMPQGGTYLGMLRHKGIIPWDDDADFFLRPGDEEKVNSEAFKKDLEKFGFDLRPAYVQLGNKKLQWGLKICYKAGKDIVEAGETYKFPFIDLMISTKLDSGRISYALPAARLAYPEEYFTPEEWKDKTLYTFGPLQIPGPKKAEPFCNRNFGADWKEKVVQQRVHNPDSRFPIKFTKKLKIASYGKGIEYDEEKVAAFLQKLEETI